jgi:hypothetical protein
MKKNNNIFNPNFLELIKDGISVDITENECKVFTVSTQHFTVPSINDLTVKRFKKEIRKQKEDEEKLSSDWSSFCNWVGYIC